MSSTVAPPGCWTSPSRSTPRRCRALVATFPQLPTVRVPLLPHLVFHLTPALATGFLLSTLIFSHSLSDFALLYPHFLLGTARWFRRRPACAGTTTCRSACTDAFGSAVRSARLALTLLHLCRAQARALPHGRPPPGCALANAKVTSVPRRGPLRCSSRRTPTGTPARLRTSTI